MITESREQVMLHTFTHSGLDGLGEVPADATGTLIRVVTGSSTIGVDLPSSGERTNSRGGMRGAECGPREDSTPMHSREEEKGYISMSLIMELTLIENKAPPVDPFMGEDPEIRLDD